MRFLGKSAIDMVSHLLCCYGKISPVEAKENGRLFNEPIDSSEPIDVYFGRINDCIELVEDATMAFTDAQVMQTVYHAVQSTSMQGAERKVPEGSDVCQLQDIICG